MTTSPGCTGSACSAGWACRWARSAGRSTTRRGACGPPWPPTSRDLDRRLEAGDPATRPAHAATGARWVPPTAPLTDDLLEVLEEMTMLDTTVQRRISILVYADLEAAYELPRPGLRPRPRAAHPRRRRQRRPRRAAGRRRRGVAPPGVARVRPGVAPHAGRVDGQHGGDGRRRRRPLPPRLEQGATIDYEPVDQPYGYREYSARDSEGGLWSFMKPLD